MLDPKQMAVQLGLIADQSKKQLAPSVSQIPDQQWSSIIDSAKAKADANAQGTKYGMPQ